MYFLTMGIIIRNTLRGVFFSFISLVLVCAGLFIYSYRNKNIRPRATKITKILAISLIVVFVILSILVLTGL